MSLPNELRDACENGRLLEIGEQYVAECHGEILDPDGKKPRTRFPNIAGFCRRYGIGIAILKALQNEYPEQYGALLSLFEDEALNSTQSATVLSAYLREHLEFGEKKEGGATVREGELRLVFEHDILEDGG